MLMEVKVGRLSLEDIVLSVLSPSAHLCRDPAIPLWSLRESIYSALLT